MTVILRKKQGSECTFATKQGSECTSHDARGQKQGSERTFTDAVSGGRPILAGPARRCSWSSIIARTDPNPGRAGIAGAAGSGPVLRPGWRPRQLPGTRFALRRHRGRAPGTVRAE